MRAVLVAAVMIVALMVVIKDGRAMRKVGLVGSCISVATPAGQTGYWEKCTSGKLQGAPDLTRHGCKDAGILDGAEYWQCPERLGSAQGT